MKNRQQSRPLRKSFIHSRLHCSWLFWCWADGKLAYRCGRSHGFLRKVPPPDAEGLFLRPIPSAQNSPWQLSREEGVHCFFRPSANSMDTFRTCYQLAPTVIALMTALFINQKVLWCVTNYFLHLYHYRQSNAETDRRPGVIPLSRLFCYLCQN